MIVSGLKGFFAFSLVCNFPTRTTLLTCLEYVFLQDTVAQADEVDNSYLQVIFISALVCK